MADLRYSELSAILYIVLSISHRVDMTEPRVMAVEGIMGPRIYISRR